MILIEKDYGWYKIRHLSTNPKDKLTPNEYKDIFDKIGEKLGECPKSITIKKPLNNG